MGNMSVRSFQTKLKIENALIALVDGQSLDRITVQEICAKAQVNRATFYRFFKDKYHLVDGIFEAALAKFSKEVGVLFFNRVSDIDSNFLEERYEGAWEGLFAHFAANSRIYAAMLGSRGSAWFHVRMKIGLMKLIAQVFRGRSIARRSAEVPPEIARCFFASALIGVIETWLNGGRKHSPTQMASWFRNIFYKGYVSALSGLAE
ncbi:MAG: TetR/AcrR family transcriptional regulator C-terminal domain-containing protein [Spirochaetia bacterium]|jgi:AcrR family transcriptional regulator